MYSSRRIVTCKRVKMKDESKVICVWNVSPIRLWNGRRNEGVETR
jgi:hypothetical protein